MNKETKGTSTERGRARKMLTRIALPVRIVQDKSGIMSEKSILSRYSRQDRLLYEAFLGEGSCQRNKRLIPLPLRCGLRRRKFSEALTMGNIPVQGMLVLCFSQFHTSIRPSRRSRSPGTCFSFSSSLTGPVTTAPNTCIPLLLR